MSPTTASPAHDANSTPTVSALCFQQVSLQFGSHRILDHFDMTVPAGHTGVLMGASGCGKTSLLRMAAGLLKPSAGTVRTGGVRVAVQFQEPRLIPWMTAAENVNLVLSDSKKTLPAARDWLSRVELADAADLYPDELSGGMAQRVSLARALAFRGGLVLLDEPFRGLDPALRTRMMALVKQETEHITLLLITHDSAEAQAFAEDNTQIRILS